VQRIASYPKVTVSADGRGVCSHVGSRLLADVAAAVGVGEAFDAAGWPNLFDRTQWVLTIWFPFRPGDRGEPSVWPNSPPFPAP